MNREALLEPIVSSVRNGTELSRYQILDYFKDWDVLPFEFEGRHIWTLVNKGTEVHIALAPDWGPKASMRDAVHCFFRPVFEKHGFLTTRVRHGRLKQKKFVERVGFRSTWKDGDVEYYLLSNLPFERQS